jgi:hypothetical protein
LKSIPQKKIQAIPISQVLLKAQKKLLLKTLALSGIPSILAQESNLV